MIRALLREYLASLSSKDLISLFGGPDRVVALLTDGFNLCAESQRVRLQKSFLRQNPLIVELVKLREDAKLPERASDGAIGYDVYASRILDKFTKNVIGELPFVLKPGESGLFGIGVALAVPFPYQCEIRPRSGLASKFDIELSNSPGTVDPDFRGEAGILLRNRGKVLFTVGKNMRIAQLIFSKAALPEIKEVQELSPTRRGAGGFGSTGLYKIIQGGR